MTADLSARLAEHMRTEESFQASVAASLRDLAVTAATLAARQESALEQQAELKTGMVTLDKRYDDHEVRVSDLERSMRQALTVAKWFFGGGFLAFLATAFAVVKLIEPIKHFLEEFHK